MSRLGHAGAEHDSPVSASETIGGRAFRPTIDFECEPRATGGRCARFETYWYGWQSDFHICPSWRALATEPDRTESLLVGFYGYRDIVDDNTRRQNLAALARALNERSRPAPPP